MFTSGSSRPEEVVLPVCRVFRCCRQDGGHHALSLEDTHPTTKGMILMHDAFRPAGSTDAAFSNGFAFRLRRPSIGAVSKGRSTKRAGWHPPVVIPVAPHTSMTLLVYVMKLAAAVCSTTLGLPLFLTSKSSLRSQNKRSPTCWPEESVAKASQLQKPS